MKASDMIQQHCCGQLGEKEVYLERVRRLEEVLAVLINIDAVYVSDVTGFTKEELNNGIECKESA